MWIFDRIDSIDIDYWHEIKLLLLQHILSIFILIDYSLLNQAKKREHDHLNGNELSAMDGTGHHNRWVILLWFLIFFTFDVVLELNEVASWHLPVLKLILFGIRLLSLWFVCLDFCLLVWFSIDVLIISLRFWVVRRGRIFAILLIWFLLSRFLQILLPLHSLIWKSLSISRTGSTLCQISRIGVNPILNIFNSFLHLLFLLFLFVSLLFLFLGQYLVLNFLIHLFDFLVLLLPFMHFFVQFLGLLLYELLVFSLWRVLGLFHLLELLSSIQSNDLDRKLLGLSLPYSVYLDNIWELFLKGLSQFLDVCVQNMIEPIWSDEQLVELILGELLWLRKDLLYREILI